MAAREDTIHSKRVRERIRTSQLITRLENSAMGELDPPMTADQIRCAQIVLAKSMPDLKATEFSAGQNVSITLVSQLEHPNPDA